MDETIRMPLAGQVHVWTMDLRLRAPIAADFASYLSPDELDRARRFVFELHRERYAAGRGFLRFLLGAYLNQPPRELMFECGPAGKPFLKSRPAALGNSLAQPSTTGHEFLPFNLSHCEDVAVLAVGCSAPLGVDIERVRHLDDASELVRRFFSPREARAYCSMPAKDQPRAFFNLWTRKEALLKATGEGIGHSLSRVEVGFQPGEPAAITTLPESFGKVEDWSLAELPVPDGFAAALAVRAPAVEILHSPFVPLDGLNLFSNLPKPTAREVIAI